MYTIAQIFAVSRACTKFSMKILPLIDLIQFKTLLLVVLNFSLMRLVRLTNGIDMQIARAKHLKLHRNRLLSAKDFLSCIPLVFNKTLCRRV